MDFASWSDYNYVLGNPIKWIDEDGRSPNDPKKQKQTNKGKLDQPDRLASKLRTWSDVKLWLAMKAVETFTPSGEEKKERNPNQPVQETVGPRDSFVLTSSNGAGATNHLEPKQEGGTKTIVNVDNLVIPAKANKLTISPLRLSDNNQATTHGLNIVQTLEKSIKNTKDVMNDVSNTISTASEDRAYEIRKVPDQLISSDTVKNDQLHTTGQTIRETYTTKNDTIWLDDEE